MSFETLKMIDPKDEKMSSNHRRIYMFVCTLSNCNDICLNRDKLLDHLAGHKVFETKVINLTDYDKNEEQLAEFVNMIENGDIKGETSNTARKPRLKTRNNSKKICIFNNCKKTFADRKEAIVHLRKRHLTSQDTLENDLLQISTKNVDEIVDQPKSDFEHSDMAVDYLKIELLSDTDINDDNNNGSDNQDDDQTWTPLDTSEDLDEEITKLLSDSDDNRTRIPPENSGKEISQNELVESKSSPKKRKYLPRGNKESLFVRLWDDTNKKRLFQCLKCDKCYKYRNTVMRHIAIVHDQKRSHCQFEGCSASYALPGSLRHHVSIVHNQERSHCQFEGCSASFSYPNTLRNHVSIVHTKDAVLLRCPWPDCDYATYHPRLIVRHNRVHTGERPFRCKWPDCNKTYKTHSALSQHTATHRDERPYRCKWPDCQKAYKSLSALSQHTASHRNERRHRCKWPGCSYSCNVAGSLRKHVELHEEGRLKEVAVDSGQKSLEKQDSM